MIKVKERETKQKKRRLSFIHLEMNENQNERKNERRKIFRAPIHSMIVVVFSLLNGIFFLSFTKQLDEILMVMNKQQQQLEKEMNQMKEKKNRLFIHFFE